MNTLVVVGPTVEINHCALVDCFQLASTRLNHSQLDARSAAWLSLWISLLLSLPVVPTVHQSAHGLATEASNAYFDREQPSTPAFFFAKIKELCVLCLLPLVGLLIHCLPWYCQLDDKTFLSLLDHSTMSGRRVL